MSELPPTNTDAATFEVIGQSTRSFSQATADAVARAGALFSKLGWDNDVGHFEVLQMDGPVAAGKRTGYQVRVRVGRGAARSGAGQ